MFEAINNSQWIGSISEAGIGLEFSAAWLREPGASKTIMEIHSPYRDLDRPRHMRAVSLENAVRLAFNRFASLVAHSDGRPLFGLAITGAHYEDRDSHAWVACETKYGLSYIHYKIPIEKDRAKVGAISNEIILWFLKGCLLGHNWSQEIVKMAARRDFTIDVLYTPGVGDEERLMLLRQDSLLAYCDGEFMRVEDCLREYDHIYGGTFNPVHDGHRHVGEGALWELSRHNFTKGWLSVEKTLEIVRSVGKERPIIISQEPMFLKKDALLRSYVDKKYTYHMGVDAWNLFLDHLPDRSMADGKSFKVFGRPGYSPTQGVGIDVEFVESNIDLSSSKIRNG